MHIRFCGAARTVTGSCHLIILDNQTSLLLDCGLFQGRQAYIDLWNQQFAFEPKHITALLLSHAHIDHCGRIPKLVKEGFTGPIYCTHATRDIAEVMLLDSAFIQQKDSEFHNKNRKKRGLPPIDPLYTPDDVHQAMKQFRPIAYDSWTNINSDVSFCFRDAGHILGSATVHVRVRQNGQTRTLGYTGDIGRPHRPILRDPQPMLPCQILISECTYGDRTHARAPEDLQALQKIVEDTCITRRGKLIIPAFSLGRTQEILYLLDQLIQKGQLPALPVFLDSPLAVDITTIYRRHISCFDDQFIRYLQHDPTPFGFDYLQFVTDVEQSKRLNTDPQPAIIISASGMAEAGRVVHHIRNHVEDDRNTILFVGYCAEGTLGYRLRNGLNPVRVFGEEKQVRASVLALDSFSAHADMSELLQLLLPLKDSGLSRVFLVHGIYATQWAFRDLLQQNGFPPVAIPSYGETYPV